MIKPIRVLNHTISCLLFMILFLYVSRFFIFRMFFLMEKISTEAPFEATWLENANDRDGLVSQLARFAARLHDAGFIHTDFSERHIFVDCDAQQPTFRLIDLERASIDRPTTNRTRRNPNETATGTRTGFPFGRLCPGHLPDGRGAG